MQPRKRTILVLGCGMRPHPNAINHDKTRHHSWVDVVHDLNVRPWIWSDEYADIIIAIDVLEHLDDFVASLEECYRILKMGGLLIMQLPYAGCIESFRDPTHRWFFTEESMDYFVRGTHWERAYGFYSDMRWKKLSVERNNDCILWRLEKDVKNNVAQ